MKYITHNDQDINVNMTHYQGEVRASYDLLATLFGQPHCGDGYKVDAQWKIEWEDGVVATIYNYKNGVNYLGWREGIPTELITEWNIGGHDIGRPASQSWLDWKRSGDDYHPQVERIEDLIKNQDVVTTIQGHNYEQVD